MRVILLIVAVMIVAPALAVAGDGNATRGQSRDSDLQSLLAEYDKAVDGLHRHLQPGSLNKLDENIKFFNKLSQLQRQFTGRFLELTRKQPKAEKAYEALTIVAIYGEPAQSDEATDLMIRYYPDKIAGFCDDLDGRGWPAQEGMMRKLLQHSMNDKMEKAVSFGLGRLLKAKSEGLESQPDNRAKWSKEAEGLYERIAAKPGLDAETVDALKSLLWEFRNLGIGKNAPGITGKDADGKEFKLSDYQGKVVVLDFWGGW